MTAEIQAERHKPERQIARGKSATGMVRQIVETIYLLDLTIDQWIEQLNRAQPLRTYRLTFNFVRSARTHIDGEAFYDFEPIAGRMIELKSGAWRFARLDNRVKFKKLSDLRVGKGLPGDSRVITLIDGIEAMLEQRKELEQILISLCKGLSGKLSSVQAMCAKRSDKVIDLSYRIKHDWSADAAGVEAQLRAKRRDRYQKRKNASSVVAGEIEAVQ